MTAGRPAAVPPARPDRPEARAATGEAARVAAGRRALGPRPRPGGLVPPAAEDGRALGADTARALAASRVGAAGSVDAGDLALARAVLDDVDAGAMRAEPPGTAGTLRASPGPRARPQRGASVAPLPPDTAGPDSAAPPDTAQSAEMRRVAAAIAPDVAASDPAAVSRSLRPDSRPRVQPTRSPDASGPVRVATVGETFTPRSATSGPVASRATETRALRLNKLSLIGVYGSQSNRRALVRLPSGRFVKVQVGDRVDGGRVSAIGQSELQYVKGGRPIDLTLPQG